MRLLLFVAGIGSLAAAVFGLVQLAAGLRRGVMPLRTGRAHRETRRGVFWLAVSAHVLGVLLLTAAALWLLARALGYRPFVS